MRNRKSLPVLRYVLQAPAVFVIPYVISANFMVKCGFTEIQRRIAMDDPEKEMLRNLICLRHGSLRYITSNRRLLRMRRGLVKISGKLYETSELKALLTKPHVEYDGAPCHDGRMTESSLMAAACPDMVIERWAAKEIGFTLFRTGKTCKNGHTGWRFVSNGSCSDCNTAAAATLRKGKRHGA